MKRFSDNPIIKPQDVKPSRDDFKVIGVFNAAATIVNGKTLLLLRVAEKPIEDKVSSPFFNQDLGVFNLIYFGQGPVDLSDPRLINSDEGTYLTSISHFRRAWSDDAVSFEVENEPALLPNNKYEEFGIEDPRITHIDDQYFITYTAVSHYGAGVALATSYDMQSFERKGIIFSPDNRDAVIFPRKIGGKYFALHRPNPKYTFASGKPSVWLATSNNLIDWGSNVCLFEPRSGFWDSERIGAGSPPIETPDGWLIIYHGVDDKGSYSLGSVLLDLQDPTKIIKRSNKPFLCPKEKYETSGFFNNVVFNDGAILRSDGTLDIYYAASDETICLFQSSLQEFLKTCF